MNTNLPLESQSAQPERKSRLGLVSLVFALLTMLAIMYVFFSLSLIDYNNVVIFFFVSSALSAIAIIAGGINLYLINRKVPVAAIVALITALTGPAIVAFTFLSTDLFFAILPLLLLWEFLYAIIQIILLIKNRVAILARIGIALALLCNVFVVAIFILSNID